MFLGYYAALIGALYVCHGLFKYISVSMWFVHAHLSGLFVTYLCGFVILEGNLQPTQRNDI